jgi:hypothetical protein
MPDRCWNREREVVDRGEITEIQERKMRKQAEYVYENTAYHRELFDEEGQRKVPFVIDFDTQELAASGERGGFTYTNSDPAGTLYFRWQSENAMVSVTERLESSVDVPVDVEPFDVDTDQAERKPDKIIEEAI